MRKRPCDPPEVVTTAHGHLQPQRSHQCVAGFFGSKSICDGTKNWLLVGGARAKLAAVNFCTTQESSSALILHELVQLSQLLASPHEKFLFLIPPGSEPYNSI
ncbi:hypothetical protein EVAR_103236_1 [Eumeta japonica]|uniref:Uncharacterized protein n=1 Tax=Eumeta variegata TaxID=151549 RepID=A0A4C1X8A9_EUMVA|nr:hypothetical protein EVAR_103236_1 [Eumeta japonica]